MSVQTSGNVRPQALTFNSASGQASRTAPSITAQVPATKAITFCTQLSKLRVAISQEGELETSGCEQPIAHCSPVCPGGTPHRS